jgi:hypothetical protein
MKIPVQWGLATPRKMRSESAFLLPPRSPILGSNFEKLRIHYCFINFRLNGYT